MIIKELVNVHDERNHVTPNHSLEKDNIEAYGFQGDHSRVEYHVKLRDFGARRAPSTTLSSI